MQVNGGVQVNGGLQVNGRQVNGGVKMNGGVKVKVNGGLQVNILQMVEELTIPETSLLPAAPPYPQEQAITPPSSLLPLPALRSGDPRMHCPCTWTSCAAWSAVGRTMKTS